MARRRRFSRARRFGGRFRRGAARHPKLVTRAANAIGLLIGFNQEIGFAANYGANWQTNPQGGLNGVLLAGTGFNAAAGTMDFNQLTRSAGSKIGGYILAKIIKLLVKRMRVM